MRDEILPPPSVLDVAHGLDTFGPDRGAKRIAMDSSWQTDL